MITIDIGKSRRTHTHTHTHTHKTILPLPCLTAETARAVVTAAAVKVAKITTERSTKSKNASMKLK